MANCPPPRDRRIPIEGLAGDKLYFDLVSADGVFSRPCGGCSIPTVTPSSRNTCALSGPAISAPSRLALPATIPSWWRVARRRRAATASNVIEVVDDFSTLAIGETVSGSISQPGQQDTYAFSLAADKLLYFDALTSVGLLWSLFGPQGPMVLSNSFLYGDQLLSLAAGDYQVRVTGNADARAATASAGRRGGLRKRFPSKLGSTAVCQLSPKLISIGSTQCG